MWLLLNNWFLLFYLFINEGLINKWIEPTFHLLDKQGNKTITENLVGSDLLDLKYIYLFEK